MYPPRLSVIIPCHRQAHFVARAVESVLGQSGVTVEAIVVDDGSPDDVPAALAPFAGDPRVRLLRQQNRGLPAARNAGLALAVGDVVSFLDADDWFAPERTGRLLRLLDEDPTLGFAYGEIVTVDEAGDPVPEQYRIADLARELSGDLTAALLQGGYFPPHAVLARLAAVREVGGFDETLGGYADYDLWLRLSLAGHRTAFDPEPGAFYRLHASSMSRDGRHMDAVRAATLRKLAGIAPEVAAQGLARLQDVAADLFAANVKLRTRDQPWIISSAGTGEPADADGHSAVTSLIGELPRAVRVPADADRVAVWDVELGDACDRAVMTQSPVDVVFTVPHGMAGWFRTAITIHPLAWDKPGAGPCEFSVRIDERVAYAVVLDPVHDAADRRWHDVAIRVPASRSGRHEVRLAVRSVGGSDAYRWGVWRTPIFAGDPPAAMPSGAAARPRRSEPEPELVHA